MSRELDRRIAALERVKNGRDVEYLVLDYPPEDEPRDPHEQRRPMTEDQWLAAHCFD